MGSPTEVGALRHPEVALAAERTHGALRWRHQVREHLDHGRLDARAGLVFHHEVHEAGLTEGQCPAGSGEEQGETGRPHGASGREPVGNKGVKGQHGRGIPGGVIPSFVLASS